MMERQESYMENTFAPSGRSLPMSWDRIRSQTSGSNFQYDFNSNQGRTLSGRMLNSERAPLPSTIGGQSIHRYAMERNDAIMEEPSQIERSMMTHSNLPLPSMLNGNGLLNTNDHFEVHSTFDQNQTHSHPLVFQHQANQSLSQSTLSGPTNILRTELILCKKQVSDMRSTNLFLKKEKLKAEHERNLSEIRSR